MRNNTLQDVEKTAAAWAARVFSGEFSPEVKVSLEEWLSRDDRHRRAYNAIIEIGELAEGASEGTAEQILEQDFVAFAERSRKPRYWVAVPAMAAGLAVILSAVALFPIGVQEATQYATARGQSLEITLDDKSVIALNTDTSIEVRYTENRRIVSMDKGEALFLVTPDADRPFYVDTPYANVNVTGTRFVMRALGGETVVAVLSGSVEVEPAGDQGDKPSGLSLTRGQSVSVEGGAGLQEVTGFDADAVMAWRRGIAFYDSVSLADVVIDLNRYFERQFVLGDKSLSEIPVSGRFDIDDQDIVTEALSVALSLRAEKRASGAIVLLPSQ